MILEKITIKNFMSHKETEIDFKTGVTAFIGPNGAGKSSILDAVYYALYGKSARGTISELIKKGKSYCQVELTFRCGGKRYYVKRSHSLTGLNATATLFEILENGKRKIIAREPTAVTEEIEKLVGLNHKVFLQIIYVRQGELEKIILEPRAKRKEFMSKILGIDSLQKAYDNMREVISSFKCELERIKGEIKQKEERKEELEKAEKDLKNLEERRRNLLEELSKIKSRLTEVREQLIALENQRLRYEHFKAELEKNKRDLERLENKINELREKLTECINARERMKEIEGKVSLYDKLMEFSQNYHKRDSMKSELSELENDCNRYINLKDMLAQVEERYNEYQEIEGRIEELERMLENYAVHFHELQSTRKEQDNIKKELDEYLEKVNEFKNILEKKLKVSIRHDEMEILLRKTKDSIERIIEERKQEVNSLKSDLSSHDTVIDDRRRKIEELKKVRVKCPLCGQPLTESHRMKVIRELREEIRKHRLEKMKIEGKIQKLKEELECYEKERTSLEKLWNEYYGKVHPKLTEIKKLEKKLQELDEKCKFLEEMAKEYVKLKETRDNLKNRKKKLEKYVTEYNKLKAELETLEEKHGSLNELKSKIELIREELRALENKIAEFESSIGLHFESWDEVEFKLNELSKFKSEYQRLKSEFEKLKVIEGQLQTLIDQRDRLKLEIKRLKEFLKKIQYDPKKYETVKREYEQLQVLGGKYEGEEKSLREQIIKVKQQTSALKEKLRKLEAKEEYGRRLEEFIKLLEKLRFLYGKDGLQKQIRERAIKGIERLASNFLERFGLGISHIEFNENFDIKVYSAFHSEAIPVRNLSGGEIIAVALAFRFALAKLIAGERMEMLILDEPTTFLDETRRKDLINIIRDVFMTMERMLPQLIIVTHNRELEEAATTVYFVDKDATGSSRVTLQEDAKI